ncbi:HD domain-containing protein [Anaerobacillus sp. MEB173]|uniref:HD domain-containing protein n=1 Tax=Anaerobacillus sp. MEB173 TaxID=3383345 RepID=UPI003F8E0903
MYDNILGKAELFVKEQLEGDSSGHDWWHIYRVTKLATTIAQKEGANQYICTLAALLHDVADEKLNESEEAGLKKVSNWLMENGVAEEDHDVIMEIIEMISFKGGNQSAMRTLEGKVVQDADRLDAIGAIGAARTFAYAGWKGQPMYDPEIIPRQKMTKEEYRTGKSTAINHFYEKLFTLKETMNTDYAKQLAEERHRRMEQFVEEFMEEWEGKS